MKKLIRLAVVATVALLLRASVQAQNLTPGSSTTPNGTATAQTTSNADSTSQSSTPATPPSSTPQDTSNKAVPKTDKGSSKQPKNKDKDSGPRYGRNQTVLR